VVTSADARPDADAFVSVLLSAPFTDDEIPGYSILDLKRVAPRFDAALAEVDVSGEWGEIDFLLFPSAEEARAAADLDLGISVDDRRFPQYPSATFADDVPGYAETRIVVGNVLVTGQTTDGLLQLSGLEPYTAGASIVFAEDGVAHLERVGLGPSALPVGETRGVVNDDDVRLRTGPSMDAAVIRTLDSGTVLDVTGPSAEGSGFRWWPVRDPGTGETGYVRADYLDVAS
jgi:hypothetical protein